MNLRHQAFVLPFSLASGQGLGISHASLSSIGAFLVNKPLGQAGLGCYVNVANGNFIVQDKELLLPNGDQSIHLAYYNSLDTANPWCLTATRSIKQRKKNQYIIMKECDGHEVKYIYNENKRCYIALEGNDGLAFIQDDNDQIITWNDPKSRHSEQFDLHTKSVIHIDEVGRPTHYSYDKNNQLTPFLMIII